MAFADIAAMVRSDLLMPGETGISSSEVSQIDMMDDNRDCIVLLDLNGRVQWINQNATRALELASAEMLIDRSWEALWPADMQPRVSLALQSARSGAIGRFTGYCPTVMGSERWWDAVVSLSPAGDDAGQHLVLTLSDATARRVATKRLRWLTTHDELTGLPNRRLFGELFHQQIETSQTEGRSMAIAMFSIDQLKQVNDSFGPACGDALLKAFAGRLDEHIGGDNIATRLGGNEFAVVLAELPRGEDATDVVSSLLARVCTPFQYGEKMIDCGVSAGLALFPEHGTSTADLLRYADSALDVAKDCGSGHVQCFNGRIRQVLERQSSEAEVVRDAVVDDWIQPRYQPKVDLHTGQVIGHQSVPGWRIPADSSVTTDILEAAFEGPDQSALRSGILLDKILSDLRYNQKHGVALPVAIKATSQDILCPSFSEKLLNCVEQDAVSPACIELEVAEDVFADQDAAIVEPILSRLAEAGVKIIVDGFGRGHASLNHLREFPIHMVKIDPSIIRNITTDAGDLAIVEAAVQCADHLSISVIADGLETTEQAELAAKAGCVSGQGPLFGMAC